MNLSDIRSIYACNRWANLRMFSVLEKLGDEQFQAQGARMVADADAVFAQAELVLRCVLRGFAVRSTSG